MREVLDWDHYFMEVAKTVSIRSKDPRTQVGAVVVNPQNQIIATGYNGMQPMVSEDASIWTPERKNDYVIHAEMNAILNATQSVKGCTVYVTLHPCKECAKLLGAAGIAKVYYLNYRDNCDGVDYSRFCPIVKL